MAMLRILHLNSMLKGGGTDDQCIKAATGLLALGHEVAIARPGDRECSALQTRIRDLLVRQRPLSFSMLRKRFSAKKFKFSMRITVVITGLPYSPPESPVWRPGLF